MEGAELLLFLVFLAAEAKLLLDPFEDAAAGSATNFLDSLRGFFCNRTLVVSLGAGDDDIVAILGQSIGAVRANF